MKKTNFTSIQPSWCLGSNWLKGVLPLLALFAFMLPMQVHAQAPNCAHGISPSIDDEGYITLTTMDLLSNPGSAAYPIDVSIYNEWGGHVQGSPFEGLEDGDDIELYVCNYLGKNLDFSISNEDGNCNQGLILLNGTPAPQLISAFGTTITEASDLDLPTARIDTGLLVTYCGYVPEAEDHEPTVEVPCGGNYYGLSAQPDWVEVVHCNEESDTSEIIYRKWEVFNKDQDISTLTDTIVVLRLPMLTAESFVGYMEDTTYCEIEPLEEEGESVKRFAAWKQPLGIHDYEEAYSKLGGVAYQLPASIIAAGLINAYAQGENVWEEYLECVILKKLDGTEITIGDIVGDFGGSPFDTDYFEYLADNTNSSQIGYGFLHAIYELGEDPINLAIGVLPPLSYFPYLLLEKGDWVLSENGFYEQVTEDWFYNGNANSPYWFAGAWPSIYGSGDCVRYCDVAEGEFGSCAVRMLVPALEEETNEPCVEICLDDLDGNPHCGISIEVESQEWAGACPATKGQDITVTQTCWGVTENECVWEDFDEENTVVDLDASDFESDKKKVAVLSQWLTLIDTIGPIFDFCYPEQSIANALNELGGYEACDDQYCGPYEWDHEEIVESIRNGEQYESARFWENCNPTVYTTGSHDCAADVYVPSVTLKDECSGVHHVKAMVNGRAVLLERVSEADGYVTFAHTEDPISIPFQGHGNLTEVRYEAADSCWNLSEWYKYIEIKDATPPTVVVDDEVRVSLTNKVAWVNAETFDEGSWDNCGISLRLARRVDWWADTACVDLCSNGKEYDNWVDLLVDLGFAEGQVENVLGGDVLCGDYTYDIEKLHEFFLEHEEVEAHYYEKLKWLWEDGQECGPLVVHGWLYDIARYVAENCGGTDEHGNPLDLEDLESFFDGLTGVPGYGKEVAYLGGGWSKAVPFKCEDACEQPMVELLVMDYWCNWGKAWVLVDVEDKSQAEVSKELEDITISCEAYNLFYKDVVEEAAAYNAGGGSAADTSGAYAALDEAFGRYIKTWVNNQGQPTDIDGNILPDSVLQFYYNTVVCEEKSITEKIADTLHDGTIDWITEVTKESYLDTIQEHAYNGVIAVNCTATCEQDVWIDLDDCGYGTITRRFFIQGGCSDKAPEWEVEQVIHVEPACEVRLSMFDLPEDLGTKDEPVCIPSEDNIPTGGAYGDVALLPHLEGALCNAIAVGHEDKVSNVLGTDMKKIERVWSIKDWCKHDSEKTYTQVIIATVDADCDFGGGEDTTGVDTGDVSLTGVIATTASEEVEQVEVKAVLGSGSPLTTVTTGNGGYEFNIAGGSQVSLVPSKNTGHLNGLSVIDVVSIQSHVLQKNTLEGDYERIAADVDGDGGIDALDVLQLRKLIMTKDGQLANNTSWRFFVNDGTMKESFEIASLNENMNVDFVGVKVGDVDLSGDPSRSSRSNRANLNLSVADRALKAGQTYRLDVTSDNFENIAGMQYTLEYASSQVEVETIEAGALNYTKDHFVKAGAGIISSVWNEAKSEGVSLSSNEVLFTIVLKAKADVQLRDVLSLSDKFTMTEAATSDLEARNISLNFNGTDNNFALYQNTPNPYAGKTVIGFNLPEASDAKLSVYDVTGKVLKIVEGSYNQGYNEVELLSSDLNTTGVLYYQLDTKTYTATKKMIVIE